MKPLVRLCCALLIGMVLNQEFAFSQNHLNDQAQGDIYEGQLLSIVDDVNAGNLIDAQAKTAEHLKQYPKSRVGYLLKADIARAMSGSLGSLDKDSLVKKQSAKLELKKLRQQLLNRRKHARDVHAQISKRYPSNLLAIGNHPYVIVGDVKEGRLYLYENNKGKPQLVKDYYMSVGSLGYGKQTEGDNKTPVGIYTIYKYIDDKKLPDLYGRGAFPVNYPNKLDRYRKRSGYGIWLHGTPSSTYARAPLASEGCFVVSNDDFEDISRYIKAKDKTPVLLVDGVTWLTWEQLQKQKQAYIDVMGKWQLDWQSLNTQAYLGHYSQSEFNFSKSQFKTWAKRKQQTNRTKTFVQVDIQIQDLFDYPGEKDMFWVAYKQSYLSNNHSSRSIKQQYWQRNKQGQWKILYEN